MAKYNYTLRGHLRLKLHQMAKYKFIYLAIYELKTRLWPNKNAPFKATGTT